jgi:hypothetical protein
MSFSSVVVRGNGSGGRGSIVLPERAEKLAMCRDLAE